MSTLVLMVRPKSFGFDPQTATDNHWQLDDGSLSPDEIQARALGEFDAFVSTLRAEGVDVIVIEDTVEPPKPNAVFPNNWISFHEKKTAILYPMRTPSRRVERRLEILDTIRLERGLSFEPQSSLLENESSGKFLEGTGSVVFDYVGKCAYACVSERTNPGTLFNLGEILNDYYFHSFEAFDKNRKPIYHTNVMMCVAEKYAVICLAAIPSEGSQRQTIAESLQAPGREIVELTLDQLDSFAGNMMEVVSAADGASKLIMSQAAFDSLTTAQKTKLSEFSKLVPVPVPTIEKYGGGSVRCMMCSVTNNTE